MTNGSHQAIFKQQSQESISSFAVDQVVSKLPKN